MWRELTEDDVLAALNDPETRAYQTAAISDGQQVLAQVIRQVVDECRGHIGDCARNRLGAGATLPERVHYHALAMIRFRLMTRLDMEVSEDRRQEQRDALRYFERVSECRVQIEQPDNETDTSGPTTLIEVVTPRERQATRENLSGL